MATAGGHARTDGKYSGTFDERFARADTEIIVARPRLACVAGAVARTARSHGEPIQAEGCPERFDLAFCRWIWNYERDSRCRLDDALQQHGHPHVVELKSRHAMTEFLDHLDLR